MEDAIKETETLAAAESAVVHPKKPKKTVHERQFAQTETVWGTKVAKDTRVHRKILGVDWRNFVLAMFSIAASVLALFSNYQAALYLVFVGIVFVPVERVLGWNMQRVFRRGWWSDVVHSLTYGVFVVPAYVAFWMFVVKHSSNHLRDVVNSQFDFLPSSVQMHLLFWNVQVPVHWIGTAIITIEAVLLSEFFYYWAHRIAHENHFLWKFHALHHSIDEMDWLAAGRLHVIDQAFTRTVAVLPVYLLFGHVILAKYIVITGFQAFFIHSNLDLNIFYKSRFKIVRATRYLKWVFATPEFHHWHHANHKEAWNKNYSEQFPFLDWMFGTLYMPQDRKPTKYGIGTLPPVDYFGQQIWSFGYLRRKKNKAVTPSGTPVADAPGEGAGLPSHADVAEVLKKAQ